MIIQMGKESQITIPKELVQRVGLKEGDKLEISEKDGVIQIMPVAVYPKAYLAKLNEEIREVKGKMESGDQPTFSTVEELLKHLDEA